ncbi:MAG: MFS transporter [Verrucomicrobia bacterium]|nr:MFS transporter [Verrucomicrobiota bacterium]
MITAFFVISLYGEGYTSSTLAYVGALALLPFLLFSTPGGILADRYSKTKITQATRIASFIIVLLGTLFFFLQSISGTYLCLFLLSAVEALFGPSKYGILPEIYPPEKILYANSVIASFTFFGILIGTALASFFITFSWAFLTLTLLALLQLVLSFFLPTTTPLLVQKKEIFHYQELWLSLKEMKAIEALLPSTLAFAYFLFIGAFLQLNMIPFSLETLNISMQDGGYLFLLSSIGMGLGSFFSHRFSKEKIPLTTTPFLGWGISLSLLGLVLFPKPLFLTIFWLFALGILGGLFLVPLEAYILIASPAPTRGRNFSTANFLSFLFAVLGAVALYLLNDLLGLSARLSFLLIAAVNALFMLFFRRSL